MSPNRDKQLKSLGIGAITETFVCGEGDARTVLKRLHRHLVAEPQCVAMIRHEARVLNALCHPNVVAALSEAHELDGTWEFEETYLHGETLAQKLAVGAQFGLRDACAIAVALLRALDHIHHCTVDEMALSIVHRDVCPANVMLTPTSVVLIDFGLATSAWRQDPDRGIMRGTRGYMAPEVITGAHTVDARSDLFGVGVILYELTVGKRLYDGPWMRVMSEVVEGETPSPRLVHNQYPPALDAVVRRALARDVDQRYDSARAMGVAILNALKLSETRT
jgi:eukaryotic-like serine/threonine-protein kinase